MTSYIHVHNEIVCQLRCCGMFHYQHPRADRSYRASCESVDQGDRFGRLVKVTGHRSDAIDVAHGFGCADRLGLDTEECGRGRDEGERELHGYFLDRRIGD